VRGVPYGYGRKGAGMTSEEITEWLRLLEDNMVYFDELLNDKGEYIDVHELLFEAIEALEQEPCEDCISRKAVLNCIETHCNNLSNVIGMHIRTNELLDTIRQLSSVNPQPKTECSCEQIKWERDAAIAQLKELGYGLGEKLKIGRWINIEDRTDWYDAAYKCSCCGREIITPYEVKNNLYSDYPYCHCGAKMVEPQESEGT